MEEEYSLSRAWEEIHNLQERIKKLENGKDSNPFMNPPAGMDKESVMNSKPENVKCPDCEGPMVSRSGQYGRFWGCRNFPECRGTRDSMGRSKAEREAEKSLESDSGWHADNEGKDPRDRFRFRKQ